LWNYLAVAAQRESPAHVCKHLGVHWSIPKVL
uniref:Transposase n=1 Tax=Echinostoma caproni TaxID=27848 RepID=A0A183BGK8_9TREM